MGCLGEFLWDSYGISLWFLCYFHVMSMIFLWDFHDITSMIVLRVYFGMSIESKLKSIENKFKLS